jgi:hypothetical protein
MVNTLGRNRVFLNGIGDSRMRRKKRRSKKCAAKDAKARSKCGQRDLGALGALRLGMRLIAKELNIEICLQGPNPGLISGFSTITWHCV